MCTSWFFLFFCFPLNWLSALCLLSACTTAPSLHIVWTRHNSCFIALSKILILVWAQALDGAPFPVVSVNVDSASAIVSAPAEYSLSVSDVHSHSHSQPQNSNITLFQGTGTKYHDLYYIFIVIPHGHVFFWGFFVWFCFSHFLLSLVFVGFQKHLAVFLSWLPVKSLKNEGPLYFFHCTEWRKWKLPVELSQDSKCDCMMWLWVVLYVYMCFDACRSVRACAFVCVLYVCFLHAHVIYTLWYTHTLMWTKQILYWFGTKYTTIKGVCL